MNELENNEVGKVTKIGIIQQKKSFLQDYFRVLNMESQSRETLKKNFSGSEYDLRKYSPIFLFHCK